MKEVDKTIPFQEYVDMLSKITNEIHVSCKNGKTGPLVLNCSFPTVCCREDAPCGKDCYCKKGHQAMAKILAAYSRNLRIYTEDKKAFWEQLCFKLKYNPYPYFRWFDAGDMPSEEFFAEACTFADKFPQTKFIMFTKHYEYVNNYLDKGLSIPDNLCVRFSYWGKDWIVENPYELPTADVLFKNPNMNREILGKYVKCPNQQNKQITCSVCGMCFNKKIKQIVFEQH